MGYQESYVTHSNFEELVTTINVLGESHFDYVMCYPVAIITLKKPITVTLDEMCRPDTTIKFEAGQKFVYFTGERSGQRSVTCLLGKNTLSETQIIFTECFPSHDIFVKNSKLADIQEFEFIKSCMPKCTITIPMPKVKAPKKG
jgi:hypothetical protein